jgi:probable F420-dependent oxidoreductase
MDFSYGPWGQTIGEFVDTSVQAEQAGFTRVWANEMYRSPFIPLAATATATSRIGIGTAVALAFVRSPMVTALSSLDLDELSEGRFVLGLGSGVARLNQDWHNVDFGKPVEHLQETVSLVRRFIATAHLGKPIDFEGTFEQMRIRGFERPYPPTRETVPIYIGAVGPRLTELAGAVADGWISHELCSPLYLRDTALPHLEIGRLRAGRNADRCRIVASACCMIDQDSRLAHRTAARLVAFYATVRTYLGFFEQHGFGAEAERIGQLFRAGNHDEMVDACPDEMVDAVMLAGTADQVRSRLADYEGLADELKLSVPTHLVPEEEVRSAQNEVLQLFV